MTDESKQKLQDTPKCDLCPRPGNWTGHNERFERDCDEHVQVRRYSVPLDWVKDEYREEAQRIG